MGRAVPCRAVLHSSRASKGTTSRAFRIPVPQARPPATCLRQPIARDRLLCSRSPTRLLLVLASPPEALPRDLSRPQISMDANSRIEREPPTGAVHMLRQPSEGPSMAKLSGFGVPEAVRLLPQRGTAALERHRVGSLPPSCVAAAGLSGRRDRTSHAFRDAGFRSLVGDRPAWLRSLACDARATGGPAAQRRAALRLVAAVPPGRIGPRDSSLSRSRGVGNRLRVRRRTMCTCPRVWRHSRRG